MHLLLADDHVLFRDALIQYIKISKPNWTMTTASNFDSAYKYIENGHTYDLFLIDLRMPGMNNMDGLRKTLDNHPKQMTAILSGVAKEGDVKKAMTIGARAYLPKTLSGKALVKAIELVVYSEQKFIPMDETGTKIMPAYFDDYTNLDLKNTPITEKVEKETLQSILTKRELEVLRYLSKGLSNKEIALAMNIQVATVKLHVSGVCKKLSVTNRTQAAIMAYNYGIKSEMHI